MECFKMGALNKLTNQYEYPKFAQKLNKYICPDCKKDVILRKGKIRTHHFAHIPDKTNPCIYYEKPTESQIHKDGKMLLKNILDNKRNIYFERSCNKCHCDETICTINNYEDQPTIVLEYGFNYNNSRKSADVAYLINGKLKYIFEICYKHITNPENRPEPWFEIDAEELIKNVNNADISAEIKIQCIRNQKCEKCIIREEEERKTELERKKNVERIELERKKRAELAELERKKRIEIEKKRRDELYEELKKEQQKRAEIAEIELKKRIELKEQLQKEYDIQIIKNNVIRENSDNMRKNINEIYTKEQCDNAYRIQRENSDNLRKRIFLLHKCKRCTYKKCNSCSNKINNDYSFCKRVLPTFEDILKNIVL